MAKKTELVAVKRRDGRYAVKDGSKYVNGDAKIKFLKEQGLIKFSVPAKKPVEEVATETAPVE